MTSSMLSSYSALRKNTAVHVWINKKNPSMHLLGRYEAGKRAADAYRLTPSIVNGARRYSCLDSPWFFGVDLTSTLVGRGPIATPEDCSNLRRIGAEKMSGQALDFYCQLGRDTHNYGVILGDIERVCAKRANAAALAGNFKRANIYAVGAICACVLLWTPRLGNAIAVGCVAAVGACFGAAQAWLAQRRQAAPADAAVGLDQRRRTSSELFLKSDEGSKLFDAGYKQVEAMRDSLKDAPFDGFHPVASTTSNANIATTSTRTGAKPKAQFSDLPTELVVKIAAMMPDNELLSFGRTSESNRIIANNEIFNNRNYASDFNCSMSQYIGRSSRSAELVTKGSLFGQDAVSFCTIARVLVPHSESISKVYVKAIRLSRHPLHGAWSTRIRSSERLVHLICSAANEKIPDLTMGFVRKNLRMPVRMNPSAIEAIDLVMKWADGGVVGESGRLNVQTIGLQATLAGLSEEGYALDRLLANPAARVSRAKPKYESRSRLWLTESQGWGSRFYAFHPLDIVYANALHQDHKNIVEKLINQEPEFCSPTPEDLLAAIWHGAVKTVSLLIGKGVSIDKSHVRAIYERTLAYLAEYRGKKQARKYGAENLRAAERCLEACRIALSLQNERLDLNDREILKTLFEQGKLDIHRFADKAI